MSILKQIRRVLCSLKIYFGEKCLKIYMHTLGGSRNLVWGGMCIYQAMSLGSLFLSPSRKYFVIIQPKYHNEIHIINSLKCQLMQIDGVLDNLKTERFLGKKITPQFSLVARISLYFRMKLRPGLRFYCIWTSLISK